MKKGPLFSLLLVMAILAVFIFLFFSTDEGRNQENRAFLAAYGWQVSEKPTEIAHVPLPEEADALWSAYLETLRPGGFDLAPYGGKTVSRYTYRVYNHQKSEKQAVFARVWVDKNTILAADLCSLSGEVFFLPASDISGQLP